MKTFYTFGAIVMLWLILNGLTAQTLEQKVLNVFSTLDLSQVPSGILYERSLEYLPLKSIDGHTAVDTQNFSPFQLALAYGMMEYANVDSSHRTYINPYFDLIKSSQQMHDTIPIGMVFFGFDMLKPWSLDSNLIMLKDTHFYDVPNRTELPYLPDTTLLMSLCTDIRHDKQLKFLLPNDLLQTNFENNIDLIQINLDDGKGWQEITLGQLIEATYHDYDTYIIKIIVKLKDGSMRFTSDLLFIEPETSGFIMPEGYGSVPDDSFHIGPSGVGVMVHFFLNKKCGDNKIRKPFIMIEGFDPAGKYNWGFVMDPKEGILNRDYLLEYNVSNYLKQESYDIFYINYDNGSQSNFENAHWVSEAINEINKRKHAAGSLEKNLVVGASMGGLVGKIALRSMEINGPDHETEAFISFDSPLKGANIPLGLQMMVDHLANHEVFNEKLRFRKAELNSGYNALNSEAAREMLYYHYSQADTDHGTNIIYGNDVQLGRLHDDFMNKFNALGNLDIPHYGIANGTIVKENGKGVGQKFEPGEIMMSGSFCLTCGDWQGLVVSLNHEITVRSIDELKPTMVYDAKIRQSILFLDFSDERSFITVNLLPYDSAPGGIRSFNSIKNGEEIEEGHDWIPKGFCFIPTISALALNEVDPYFKSISLQDKDFILSSGLTYLKDYEGSEQYAQRLLRSKTFLDYNMEHVTLDKNIARWLLKNTTTIHTLTNPLSTTYHIGKAAIVNYDNSLNKVRNIIDFDLEIIDGGSLWVGRKGRIAYVANIQNPDNSEKNEISLDIKRKFCIPDTTVVCVKDGGNIKVGYSVENYRSKINVWDSARLIIKNQGSVNIDDHSYLNIYKGGKLIIDQGGRLTGGLESKIQIHNGGELVIIGKGILNLTNNAEVIVEEGGTIIVEPGAIFRLQDGPLDVDGKCRVHIKRGGKLIYRGAWKHEGNGYIQFDKDHILITHQTFGIRGIEKGIRFMRLNTGCNLKILQDVILGKGKVDYEPGSKIEVASAAASITYDSLVCQGTINHVPSFSTGSIALLSYGTYININFSDFYNLENGIKHVSLTGKFGTANGEKMDLKRTISSEVKYPLVAAGMRMVQLDSVYFTNGIYSEIKECLRTELLRVGISRMSTTGFKLNDAKYFIVRNSFFTNNAIGIEGITKSNIFCYQTSFIGQPIQAIKMTGTYDDGLVELGCCNFQNNGVCVGGVDILFSLNPQSVNPQLGTYGLPGNNKFIISAPQKYFHVQYLTRYVTEVDAKYNYWGGGTPAPSDYFLKYYSRDISLEYDPYYSILINCIPQTPPNNPQNCQLIGTNSGIGFNQITNQAMTEFHQGAIETTQQIMSEISDLQNMDYWTVSAHCRFIYDYARVFTNEPLPPHQEPIISSVSDQNNTKLHINPNPFINELGIEFEEKYKSLKITNIYGQLMFESTKSDNSLRLNINTGIWPDGIYLIKIVDSSDNAHKQLALKVIRN